MRDASVRPSDEQMVNGDGRLRRDPTSSGHQLNGFTAVNGESQGSSSFRADDSAKQYMPQYANDNTSSRRPTSVTSDLSFHSHGWRPSTQPNPVEPSPAPREASPPRKRKRSIAVNVETSEENNGSLTDQDARGSPKRRATSTLDSAIDLTSPVTNMQSVALSIDTERRQQDPPPIGPYARERSPVARWNRGEPPPKPSTETEASLAESVNKFHQTQRIQEIQHSPEVERQQSSPLVNGTNQQEASISDDEDEQQGDSTDPKKSRKRNFSNRTKTGCHTCRNRKKKCDEKKPVCGNCERGNFPCQGYGPKPPNGTKVVPVVRHLHVQPKGYDTPAAPGAWYQSPSDEAGLSYSHWGRVPVAEIPPPEHGRTYVESNGDTRYPPPSRDGWHRHGWPSHFQERFPPTDYPHAPQWHYASAQPALPPPQQPPHPQISDPFAAYGPGEFHHRPSNRPPTVASSHSGSGPTHNSQHAAHLALTIAGFQPTEKEKMLRGQPFMHWLDNVLIGERDSCSIAVDCYNKGSRTDKGLSRDAKAGLFAQILDPYKRIHGGQRTNQEKTAGPIGTVKDQTIVESPFKCDYGYNIHLGNSSVLQAGCYMQDAADITIGDRVIIGPDVKIHTLTANVKMAARKGSQGQVTAGAVLIEDDVFVGANVIILPYCTIGRGAIVGAGSVVTRDVKENTVVAGNPAKFIRSINTSTSENQADRRHAYEIQERNERVKKRMVEYANSGFTRYSPRPI